MIDCLYLECHNDLENKHRFYQLLIMPGLLDDWSLVRECGRVGSPGTVRKDWSSSVKEAKEAHAKIRQAKVKKAIYYAEKMRVIIFVVLKKNTPSNGFLEYWKFTIDSLYESTRF